MRFHSPGRLLACAAAFVLILASPGRAQNPPALPPPPAVPEKTKAQPKSRSMAAWSTAEFLKAMPELKGLEPAVNQEPLTALLEGASQNVKQLFDSLPDVVARERIDIEDPLHHTEEDFNYLALRPPENAGIAIEEYRTDDAGKRVEPATAHGFVTKGAVSMVIHFHPLYLPGSWFRYLGRQKMDNRPADVVYFEQIPGRARVIQSLISNGRSIVIMVQGVAWIDSEDHHILRMRTDLLQPDDDPELEKETTESRLAEVRFKDADQTFWLPHDVTVTIRWNHTEFRNRHRYSRFRLFRAESKLTPG